MNNICVQLKLKTKISLDFTRKTKNIRGRACDIWHLVQVLPFVFIDVSIDSSNPLRTMMLLIKQITDIVTAPIVSDDQINLFSNPHRRIFGNQIRTV